MFASKVIVITGASDGIGAELARQLAVHKPKLVLAARNLEALESVAAECRQKGAQALTLRTDVGIEADCKNLIDQTIEHFGSIDILVNNAGITAHAFFEEVTDFSIYETLMRVNFFGVMWCTRYALPYIKTNKGQIVGVSSLIGKTGVPSRTAYAASKWAMGGFFESLRVELRGSGVDISMIFPGVVATNIRTRGFNKDGKPAGQSGLREEGAMSAEECARQMIAAIGKRQRELVMTPRGKLAQWLKLIAPDLVDRIALSTMKKRNAFENKHT